MAKVLLDALAGLQRALSGDEPIGPRLDRAGELAARIVPGCAAAGITVGAEGRAATVGHRGTPAALLDQVQYDSDRGPCLDAFRSGQVVEVPSIAAAGATWPEFGEEAGRLGIHHSLSSPLVTPVGSLGALNLYGDGAEPFDADARSMAALWADEVAMVLHDALERDRLQRLVDQLELALASRDTIGQAKGVLMHQRRIGPDQAFALLAEASQARNLKLVEIADHVARTGSLD